jgi:uncharacterized damage-inducible protein DinB
MTKSLLADAFGHHIWATVRLIDICLELSPEQLEAEVPGTYGSILTTMRHIAGGDAGYLFALTGGQTPEIDEEQMGLAELRAAMEGDGDTWTELLAADPDPDPETDCVRHRDDGTDSHAPVGVRLAQAIHHGTDHRSQICTALTSLGIEPPEIDVWAYAHSRGWLSETPSAS